MRKTHLPAIANYFLRVACLLPLPLLLGGWGLDGKMSTMYADGPVAQTQLDVFMVTLWVTGIIFVLVGGVLAYATIKFKARSSADEHAEPPPQGHGNPIVEISLIVVSVLMLVIIAIPTMKAIWSTMEVPEHHQEGLMTVKATGHQWWFKFEYAGHNADLPGGTQMPLTTANELVIPVNTPVRIDLRSVDVIHSLWVPKLAGKVDMIPNRGNYLWLMADKPGYYWGQCAEFCGESHSMMRFRTIVLSKEEFAKWAENQAQLARTVTPDAAVAATATPAPTVEFASYKKSGLTAHKGEMFDVWHQMQATPESEDGVLIDRGRLLFKEKACITCHTVRGHEGAGIAGPDLTRFGSRTTLAAGVLDNTPANLKQWLLHPNDIKPGNNMYFGRQMPGYMRLDENNKWVKNIEVNDEEADALVAYLRSLR